MILPRTLIELKDAAFSATEETIWQGTSTKVEDAGRDRSRGRQLLGEQEGDLAEDAPVELDAVAGNNVAREPAEAQRAQS